MGLSEEERELFLAEPRVAAFSVAAGPDRGPVTVPIWYQYTPGGEAWVLMSPTSRKARLIEQAGRFSLMVERVEPTARYVSVEGPVLRSEPRTEELLVEMTDRYLPPDKAAAYREFARRELATRSPSTCARSAGSRPTSGPGEAGGTLTGTGREPRAGLTASQPT